jgi:hypothetical protein
MENVMAEKIKDDQRLAYRGWAPGGYHCICFGCSETFIGAKRCITCADCAYKAPEAVDITKGYWWVRSTKGNGLPFIVKVVDHEAGRGEPLMRLVEMLGENDDCNVETFLRWGYEFIESVGWVGTKRKIEADAAYIELLEAALIKTDDDLEAEAGMSPRNPVEVTLYDGKHAGSFVTVHRPKASPAP